MASLEELCVGTYRSLRDVRLERLGRMNLLVGGNNAGKTSVLEAIGLVARPVDPGQWIQTVTNRDASGPLVDGLWALFPGSTALTLEGESEESRPISIQARFEGQSRQLRAEALAFIEQRWADSDRASPDPRSDVVVRLQMEVSAGDATPMNHELDFGSTPRRLPIPHGVALFRVFVVTPMTHRSTAQLITHLSHVIDEGTKGKAVELLRMFDPHVSDVLISRPFGRDAIRVVHERRGVVDLATFGDGMRRAFAMSVALSRASGGILLVDEIESAIHARALDSVLPWLVRAAGEAKVQIVATTHSLEAVDASLGAFVSAPSDEVITYHLRRSEGGHACLRYDLDGLRSLRDEGLDIR
ncbi:AAA family ATPase [Corallococcus macrosporus]|uniref:ATPase-like protein n=1 Tax=Myxococcus fulvus (strain ATCC BAA-855 / HW-1) TaxID=483219 RepID=F8CEX6_MYXFH|nr:ATP-binding protein [Corallococcus macrosporus]AEI67381.1 ATPase-like protein [Corallococcus macrosporus]